MDSVIGIALTSTDPWLAVAMAGNGHGWQWHWLAVAMAGSGHGWQWPLLAVVGRILFSPQVSLAPRPIMHKGEKGLEQESPGNSLHVSVTWWM